MSEVKTLVNVYRAAYSNDKGTHREALVAGIAAVCRVVMAEREQAAPAEAKQVDVAGDWATVESELMFQNTMDGKMLTIEQVASRIREAAERHYGPIVTRATLDRNAAQRERDAANDRVKEIEASSRVEHAKRLADQLDAMEKERDQYRQLFNEAVMHVDRVFQVDDTKPWPLLPDFLQLGENKFEGVVMLAEAYIAMTKERDAAVAEVESLRALVNHCHVHSGFANCGWSQMDTNMRKLFEDTIGSPQPAAPPSAAADAMGVDQLTKACVSMRNRIHNAGCWSKDFIGQVINEHIRPLFDAVLAERDEAIKELAEATEPDDIDDDLKMIEDLLAQAFVGKATTILGKGHIERWQKNLADAKQRAEAAEAERDKLAAELAEVREAMTWCFENTAVGWSVANSEWEVWQNGMMIAKAKDRTDAILAAFRSTKGKEQADA